MTGFSFHRRALYGLSSIGLIIALSPRPLHAQLTETVRGLNGVINARDAQLLEDQARRSNRPAEEPYWRNYRAGLEAPERSGEPGRFDQGHADLGFDPGDPKSFHSESAISLEMRRLSVGAKRRYREMTDPERREFDDRLAENAQRRYERMTDEERERYVHELRREQQRLDDARRG